MIVIVVVDEVVVLDGGGDGGGGGGVKALTGGDSKGSVRVHSIMPCRKKRGPTACLQQTPCDSASANTHYQ